VISHARAQALISERLDAPLRMEEAAELQAHLAGCPGCRRFAAQSESLARELRALPHLPPSPVVSRQVLEWIGDGQGFWARLTRGLQIASSPALTVVSTVILIAALGFTVMLAINPPDERVEAPTNQVAFQPDAATETPPPAAAPSPTAPATSTLPPAATSVAPTPTPRAINPGSTLPTATVPAPATVPPSPTPARINVQPDVSAAQAPEPTATAPAPPPPSPTPVPSPTAPAPPPTAVVEAPPPRPTAPPPVPTSTPAIVTRTVEATETPLVAMAGPERERAAAQPADATEVPPPPAQATAAAAPGIQPAANTTVVPAETEPTSPAAIFAEPAATQEPAPPPAANEDPPPAVIDAGDEPRAEPPPVSAAQAIATERAEDDQQVPLATPVAAAPDDDSVVAGVDLGASIEAMVEATVEAAKAEAGIGDAGNDDRGRDRNRDAGAGASGPAAPTVEAAGAGNSNRGRGRGGNDNPGRGNQDDGKDDSSRDRQRDRSGSSTGGDEIAYAGSTVVDPNLGDNIRATVEARVGGANGGAVALAAAGRAGAGQPAIAAGGDGPRAAQGAIVVARRTQDPPPVAEAAGSSGDWSAGGEPVAVLPAGTTAAGMAFTPDGAVAAVDGAGITVYERGGAPVASIPGGSGPVWSPRGGVLLFAAPDDGGDGRIAVWDRASGEWFPPPGSDDEAPHRDLPAGWAGATAYYQRVFLDGSGRAELRAVSVLGEAPPSVVWRGDNGGLFGEAVTAARVSPTGERIAFVSNNQFYVASTVDPAGTAQPVAGAAAGFDWSPGGDRLVASDGAALTVYDAAGTPLTVFEDAAGAPLGAPLWRDDGIYAAAGDDPPALLLLPADLP